MGKNQHKNNMPFEVGNSIGNRFSADNQPDTQGRPLGVKNRSTIARKVLEMIAIMPDATFEKIKSVFPDVEKTLTVEEVATIVMVGNAIGSGDVNAYKAVMDSAYGAPKVEVKNTVVNAQLFPLDPLSEVDDSTADISTSKDSGVAQTD